MSHSVMTEMTKKVLADSLKKLAATRPLSKVTIKDITDDCGLNRQTFYYHFQDIYELLGWIYQEEAIAQLRKHNDYSSWRQDFLELFHYIEKSRAFSLSVFHSIGRERLEHFMYTVTYQYVRNVVDEIATGLRVEQKDKDFVARFYTVALLGLLVQWMQDGMSESPQDIIASLAITVDGNLRSALERFADSAVSDKQ